MNRVLYTKHQLEILDGKLSFNDVRASDYTRIVKIAELNHETDVLGFVRPLLEKKKDLQAERRITTNKKYYEKNKEKLSKIRSSKASAKLYTPRQKAILEGAISYDEASVADYKRILKTAEQNGDAAKSKSIAALITRKEQEKAENIQRKNSDIYYRTLIKEKNGADSLFTQREISILNGEIEFSHVTDQQLDKIIKKAKSIKAENIVSAAELIRTLKNDPRSIYIQMLGFQPVLPKHKK